MNSDLYISEDESNDRMDECHRDISKANDQGVLKAILQGGKGRGRPVIGDEVLIHMVGQIQKGGTVYVNTRSPDLPIRTRVGSPDLPPGVSLALQTMKADEIATVTCKPDYGYGDEPLLVGGQIIKEVPANSTLVIELQLIDFRFHDCTSRKDGGVVRIGSDREGQGTEYLVYDSKVRCELIGFEIDSIENQAEDWIDKLTQLDSSIVSQPQGNAHPFACLLQPSKPEQVFDHRTVEWTLGEGAAVDIPHGVEVALRHMVKGERAVFFVRKDYACRGKVGGDALDAIWPSNVEHALYRIELIDCEMAKEYFQMEGKQRLAESEYRLMSHEVNLV